MAASAAKRYTRSKFGTVMIFLFLCLAGAFMLVPMLYLIITSFKPLDEIMRFPPRFFVMRPTLENYFALSKLLSNLRVPFSRYVFNSVAVSVVTTFLHVWIASMAAFVLSKYRRRVFTAIFIVVEFSLLFNAFTLEIPRYFIYAETGMLNTYWVYILPYLPSSLGVFLVKQYMDASVPDVLLEAARIDGAGCLRMYLHIALPAVKPALMTLTLFAFRDMWVTTSTSSVVFDEQIKLLPNALAQIANGGIARTGNTMAASVLMMILPVAVYLLSQSKVLETMSSSGIKG